MLKGEFERIVEVYLNAGIVTKNDVPSMYSRSFSERLHSDLKTGGCDGALITEAHLENYIEYSNAIYDPDKFTPKEADEYMHRCVLI